MLKLAIVGYGKMGRAIDALAPEYGFTVCARIDIGREESLDGADVAIEFSTPASVVANIAMLAERKIPIVVGTTGWPDRIEEVKALIERHDTALVWSPNFSIGVNVFLRLAAVAAELLKD